MTESLDDAEVWQTYYDRFISMNDAAWDRIDERLGRERSPEEIEEIQENFIAFTRFVWSNFVDLKLEFEDPVLERILSVRGPDALNTLGVKEDNLDALAS